MSEIGGIAGEALRQFIERIERLHAERKERADDIADVFRQAKSAGFEPKIMRALIKERACEPSDLSEMNDLLDLYRAAIEGGPVLSRARAREAAE